MTTSLIVDVLPARMQSALLLRRRYQQVKPNVLVVPLAVDATC